MDCSPPGSSIHGILQARVLEWVAFAFSMTNLDSLLKSRDITLPANIHIVKTMTFPVVMYGCESAKVHIVKIMAFPVVMYGCESWTIKKAECRRIDASNCGAEEDS